MTFQVFIQKCLFFFRPRETLRGCWKRFLFRLRGARLGRRIILSDLSINWPHQVQIDDDCCFETGTDITYASFWRPGPSIFIGARTFIGHHCELNVTDRIRIGTDCLIASGCKLIDHNHGVATNAPMRHQPTPSAPIELEDDVWLGANVVVLMGVRIGKGAVVGAGAVVTRSILSYEIWAGVPAKKIGSRQAQSSQTENASVESNAVTPQ
ncbi:hypothetical protein BH10PLA1_BH10PLA1_03340 [soil metagenome]